MSEDTTDLASDEKLCPYCAETIKAAAIKCRFCHSELSAGAEPEPVPDEAGEPDTSERTHGTTTEPVEDVDKLDLGLPGSTASSSARLVAVLLVVCLLLGGALWFLVDRSRHPDLDTAPNGQVTAASFRNAAMGAASDAAARALSYSYKTFDQDRKQARALMTAKLAGQYDSAMDQVKTQTASAKLTLKATVLSAGLVSVEEHHAKVLLFVNTVTTREGSTKQQLDQNRVLMELTRKDGGWTVSKMDAF